MRNDVHAGVHTGEGVNALLNLIPFFLPTGLYSESLQSDSRNISNSPGDADPRTVTEYFLSLSSRDFFVSFYLLQHGPRYL